MLGFSFFFYPRVPLNKLARITPSIACSLARSSCPASPSKSIRVYAYSFLDLFVRFAMLFPDSDNTCDICAIMFGTFRLIIPIRTAAIRSIVTSGKFTELCMLPFSK